MFFKIKDLLINPHITYFNLLNQLVNYLNNLFEISINYFIKQKVILIDSNIAKKTS